jgi:hypothetical protein
VKILVSEKHSGPIDIWQRQFKENTTVSNFFLTDQYNQKQHGSSFILTFPADLITILDPTGFMENGFGTKCLNYFVHFNLSVNCTGHGFLSPSL